MALLFPRSLARLCRLLAQSPQIAARTLVDAGAELMTGVRSPVSVPNELKQRAKIARLDLERLGSVRSFATEVQAWLGDASIDGLVLNAGTQVANVEQRTEDGFETTFAVNHLAQYLLLRLVMPRLAVDATVVFTTSNLHDPKTNPVAPPEHADAEKLANGQTRHKPKARDAIAAMRAYATSKLCNVLTARSLASSDFAKERGLRVIAFNPGFTPGTQLTRSQPLAFRLLFALVVPIFGVFQRMNTITGGGGVLANLALGRIVPPAAGRLYASQVERQLTWPNPSDLANEDAIAAKLWQDSAALAGCRRDKRDVSKNADNNGKARRCHRCAVETE